MKLIRSTTVALGALALALSPTAAVAHGGGTPFENCTAAYEAGHANIPESSEHYGDHLDRDQDGIGCDNPPSDFVPAEDEEPAEKPTPQESAPGNAPGAGGPDLAETGGDGMTPYYAAGGSLVVLAGAGVLLATRKRRTDS